MVAPKVAETERYIDPGVTGCYYVPAILDINTPLRAELDAGANLTDQVADVSGWLTTSNQVETPDLGRRFTGKVPGRISSEDSSISMYMDREGNDVRALLARDTVGYIVWFDAGDVATRPMDIYPVKVSSVGKPRNVGGDTAKQLTIQFAITSEPADDVAVPA